MTNTRQITFTVTQADITNGMPTNPWACPIALALNQHETEVSYSDISFHDAIHPETIWHAKTPRELYVFIDAVDQGLNPDPPNDGNPITLTFYDNYSAAMQS